MTRVAIVGMSLAGLRAAETLRRLGFDGTITAVARETEVPYDRPPLSKDFLTKDKPFDDIVLRRAGVEDLELDWRLGRSAVGLDREARTVRLDDDTTVEYDSLIIATGASPRTLPEAICPSGLGGVHALRTVRDAIAIRDALRSGPVCVIGAGFIGAEVAASCRALGVEVTLLEAQAQPMIRGLGETLGAVCAQLHRDNGVDLRLGVEIARVHGDRHVTGVELADGSLIPCSLLVVGVGVVPETGWLEGSGLVLDNGVVADETCCAGDAIFVAGDVARWPNPLFDGEVMRLEHWTNAAEQGAHVGEIIATATPKPFAPVPFVWSDQYDCKMQSVGRFTPDDDMTIVHGDLASRKFVALFGRDDRLVGALGFSQPRHVMIARRQIAERMSYSEAVAAANA